MPPRIVGTHHRTPDPQYERLMKRIMDALDKFEGEDATEFWDALEKLRDYAAMRDYLKDMEKT